MRRLLLAVAGLVLVGFAIVKLAEATMTRHLPVDAGTHLAVTVEARTKGHSPYTRLQMAGSLFMMCRLETEDTVVVDDFEVVAPDTFRFVIQPALDGADQRQLRGCLEDARVDQLQMHVLALERIPAAAAGGRASSRESAEKREPNNIDPDASHTTVPTSRSEAVDHSDPPRLPASETSARRRILGADQL